MVAHCVSWGAITACVFLLTVGLFEFPKTHWASLVAASVIFFIVTVKSYSSVLETMRIHIRYEAAMVALKRGERVPFCIQCGYNVQGCGDECPECGHEVY